MASSPSLTLDDLLEHTPLGLELVSDAPTTAPVRGVHAIEIEHPGAWLKPGSIMLTTGLRFVAIPPGTGGEEQLVEELVDSGVAALLFGLGVPFPHVPAALVQAASRHALPVLTVPADVPFFQIEDFVNSMVHGGDAHEVRRLLWLQNDLLRALAEPQPVAALVQRLGALVKGTAVVYEESGRQVASVGEGPTRLMWTELRGRHVGRQLFGVGRWFVIARPVSVHGVGYWIALASRRERTIADLGDALLESAARIFAAVSGVRALGEGQVRAEAGHLLRQLREGVTTQEEVRLWERMRAFRFIRRHPMRFVYAVPLPDGQAASSGKAAGYSGSADPLTALHDEAQLSGLPLLLHADAEADTNPLNPPLWGLVGGGSALDEWLDLAAQTHHVGLSERFGDLVDAPSHHGDAHRAAQVAVRRGHFARVTAEEGEHADPPGPGTVVRFEDVDLATWLISGRGAEATAAKARQQMAALLDRPDLVETAIAWLGHGLDIAAAAQALYLHPNSVRYRLRRIEEVLQAPVNSPTIIANLYLAFHDRLSPH